MKILHLPNSFLPWSTGGTETYSLGLAIALQKLGIESVFCIHQKEKSSEKLGTYYYQGFEVMVLPAISNQNNRLSVYSREYVSIPGFSEYLELVQPDLVHFHDLFGGSSLTHLKEVKKKDIPAILTYHSPGQSCMQRALRYGNKEICNGKLELGRCTSCNFISKGLPPGLGTLSKILGASIPIQDGDNILKRILTVATATQVFQDSFFKSIQLFDRVHAHAHWVEDLFLINGIAKSKIFFARTAYANLDGLSNHKNENALTSGKEKFQASYTANNPLKVVYLGRCDFVKGVHILIESALMLPSDAPIEFHFFGPYWESDYAKNLLVKIGNDNRFKLPQLLPPNEVMKKLTEMDVMVVPSIWPETGPLSLLEGLAAGLPIIGSNMGGISEWIQDRFNGLLFSHEKPKALVEKLELLLENPSLLTQLKKNIHFPRTMQDLACEIKGLYEQLIVEKIGKSDQK